MTLGKSIDWSIEKDNTDSGQVFPQTTQTFDFLMTFELASTALPRRQKVRKEKQRIHTRQTKDKCQNKAQMISFPK